MRRIVFFILAVVTLLAGATPVRAATSPYLLPFPRGTRVVVTEGNSEGDHEAANGEQYAFDFVATGGQASAATPVVAARAGTVIGTQSFSAGCATWACWTYVDFVLIDHGDGTSALYEFVDPRVKVGDHITQGQLIGALTQSGFSVAPHILFQVEPTPTPSKTPGWWHATSLPISFADPDVLAKVPDGVPTRAAGPYSPFVTESVPTTPPINEVPLNELTKESGGAYDWPVGWDPGKNFMIQNATLVAVEKGPTPDSMMIALTLKGSKSTRKEVSIYPFKGRNIPMYYYEGLTVWYRIDSNSGLAIQNRTSDTNGGNPVAGGVDNIMPYLEVGNVVWILEAPLSGGGTVSDADAKLDVDTYNRINSSIGRANNRTDRAFVMYADTITVVPSENE
jgi:murein DD-endopeptidase MepM/ murein hydrolase activator NlpD